MPKWTSEQILALAPDASSAKAGKGLAAPRKWVTLECSDHAAWGECSGSAKKPYQAQIDLDEPAFHCTCPSRKFPCKHTLALFLLLAEQPSAFKQTTPPAWVADWLEGRAKRAQQRAQRQERAEPISDPEAQARRAAEREAKVAAGLQELERWVCDLVRRGLAAAQTQPSGFWEAPAARLVDAQAPGVARLVRDLAGIPSSGQGWQERLLERLSRLYLLLEGFKRLDTLPPATQADIRALIGWTQSQDELLAEPGVRDHWLILGQRVEEEDRMRVQRTWLWGQAARRAALILHFALAKQPMDASLVPGTGLEADLVFYPGACPLRALIKTRHSPPVQLDAMPGYPTVLAASEAYRAALLCNPWLERFPLALEGAIPARYDDGWTVRDAEGHFLPLAPHFDQRWRVLALSSERLTLFGEWNGDHFWPLSAWAQDRFVRL